MSPSNGFVFTDLRSSLYTEVTIRPFTKRLMSKLSSYILTHIYIHTKFNEVIDTFNINLTGIP